MRLSFVSPAARTTEKACSGKQVRKELVKTITTVAMAEEMVAHILEESGHFALVEEPQKFHSTIKQ